MLTNQMEKADFFVAICRSSSIGDVVLASAYIDLLERLPLRVFLIWLGRSPAMTLLQQSYPLLVCQSVDEFKREAFVQKYSRLDLVINLQGNLRSVLISRFLKRHYGASLIRSPKRSWYRTRLIGAARLRGRSRAIPQESNAQQFYQYALSYEATRRFFAAHTSRWSELAAFDWQAHPHLPEGLGRGCRPEILRALQGSPRWLAVAPGAAHATKKAPLELFVATLNHYKTLSHACPGLILLGAQAEKDDCQGLLNKLSWPQSVVDLSGQTSLEETTAILHRSIGILCNDSSLGHIAEAVGRPSFVFFGPTVEAFGFAPWRTDSRAFSAPLGCRPCSKHGKVPCRYGDKQCFHMIDPQQVARSMVFLVQGG